MKSAIQLLAVVAICAFDASAISAASIFLASPLVFAADGVKPRSYTEPDRPLMDYSPRVVYVVNQCSGDCDGRGLVSRLESQLDEAWTYFKRSPRWKKALLIALLILINLSWKKKPYLALAIIGGLIAGVLMHNL